MQGYCPGTRKGKGTAQTCSSKCWTAADRQGGWCHGGSKTRRQAQALPHSKTVNADCGTTRTCTSHSTAQYTMLSWMYRLGNAKAAATWQKMRPTGLACRPTDYYAKQQPLQDQLRTTESGTEHPPRKQAAAAQRQPWSSRLARSMLLLLLIKTVNAASMRCRSCCLCLQETDMLLLVQATRVTYTLPG